MTSEKIVANLDDTEFSYAQTKRNFDENFDFEAHKYSIGFTLTVELVSTYSEVLDFIQTLSDDLVFKPTQTSNIVFFSNKNIVISFGLYSGTPFAKIPLSINIHVYGEKKEVEQVYNKLSKFESRNDNVVITWVYGNDGSKQFNIKKKSIKVADEYYPFIDNISDYCKEFDESTSNILILLGPPGTGKTNFIKYLLKEINQNAMTTYDQDLMLRDQLYINFINSPNKYLVLEDSDILLLSRERDDNRVMNKILNASDGLVSSQKKFIFSANLQNENQIDDALTRPGRCYDIKHFRPLKRIEADKVSALLGKEPLVKTESTLAEIFNSGNKKVKSRRSFGFVNVS